MSGSRLLSLALLTALPGALGFGFVPRMAGVDPALLNGRARPLPRANPACPNNPNQVPAAPITAKYPYNYAINGLPGLATGGYQVPAPGDTLHYFQAPGPNDIRGPCPGLNAAANHGFLARDGITTFNELVDAQQNIYNLDYASAVILATFGVGLDGDLVGTGRMSIGCDANSRTAFLGGINPLSNELGLNGHNTFEGDVSLTRNDYFTAVEPGDDYKMNTTLFTMMMDVCKGNCSRETLSLYRAQRFNQSVAANPYMEFPPLSIALYSAATFLYELFPTDGQIGTGDEATMMSFFGITKDSAGKYQEGQGERIPPSWFTRKTPYDVLSLVDETSAMYNLNPVQFGGNIGTNNFNGMNFSSYITNGHLNNATGPYIACQIFEELTSATIPTELGGVITIPTDITNAIFQKIAPQFENFGCPNDYFKGNSRAKRGPRAECSCGGRGNPPFHLREIVECLGISRRMG